MRNTDDEGLDARLGDHLVKLLGSHGVEATHSDGLVHIGPSDGRWVRLSARREATDSALRLHMDAGGPDGVTVMDSLNGFGDELAVATDDALLQFCVGDFHVLLAGLWGLLEEDQVDHHTVTTDAGPWDLYLGPWVSRMSDPRGTMPAPEEAFARALIAGAPKLLTERRVRAGRVFVGALDGALTYEALLDMQPSSELEAILRSAPLMPPASGYASQRLFFLALPQRGASTHIAVRRCTSSRALDVAAPQRRRHVLFGVSLAVALIVTVLFVLR